ncbi:hypothetical protein [Streptomyces sp. NPDC046759]
MGTNAVSRWETGQASLPAAARAELLDFISSRVAEILGPEAHGPQ